MVILRLARVVVLAVALAACAGTRGVDPDPAAGVTTTAPPSTTTTTAQPPSRYGGTVVIGIADLGSPRTLNPLLDGPDTAVLDLIGPAVFARGYDVEPTTRAIVPDVLAAIPSPEAGSVVDLGDGSIEVTATVDAQARWSDGSPITGDDLAYTIQTATDPDLPIRPDVARRYRGVDLSSLDVHGRSLTFRMAASTDYESFFGVIVPRHQVEGTDFAAAWNATMWAGAGPFEFASWTPGQTLELTRNETYWRVGPAGEPLPYLDRIIFRFYEPGPTLDPRVIDGLASGDLDVAWFGDTSGGQLSEVPGVRLDTLAGPSWAYLAFQFGPANRNDRSLNRYLKFRRAVAAAIDRDALGALRDAEPVEGVLGRYDPAFTESPWDRHPFDLGASLSLLGDLGSDLGVDLSAGAGTPVVLTVPDDDTAIDALAGQVVTMLRDAGLDARLQLEDPTVFYGPTTEAGTWDVTVGRFTAGAGIASAAALLEIFDPEGLPFVGDNYFRWGTIDSLVSGPAVEEYRSIVGALRAAFDPTVAADLAVRAEDVLAAQLVIIPLVTLDRPGIAFRPDLLAGPSMNPVDGAVWNVATWTRQVATTGAAP